MSLSIVGKPLDRVDGVDKVTGAATYSAEYALPQMTYAVLLQSTISKGRIESIDLSAARKVPGVLTILTHENAPRLQMNDEARERLAEKLLPLQDDRIHYNGQDIAVVVADTLEHARYAASLVKVTYAPEAPVFDTEAALHAAYGPDTFFGKSLQNKRGNLQHGLAEADVIVEQTYRTPLEHHNPMEPHATTAVWKGEELLVYDATQAVQDTRTALAGLFGLSKEKVRVITQYIGGGFGDKGWFWPHTAIAAMAARVVQRPVNLTLMRQQMFPTTGHRAETIQTLTLGARQDGHLTAIRHATVTQLSTVGDFVEACGLITGSLYQCPNLEMTHQVVRLNVGSPTSMRAPGETPGTYALESAMDELAYALKLDPVELRILNDTAINPSNDKPWSSKHLDTCYRRGAELFGWDKRNPVPGSMREGPYQIGYGMATAAYPGYRSPATARASLYADGHALVSSSTQDLGTGTYTIMTQIAADALGLPVAQVTFELGDTRMPKAPGSGGSMTAASVGPAVQKAAAAVRRKLIRMAIADTRSPLYQAAEGEIRVEAGQLLLGQDPARADTYAAILKRAGLPSVDAEVTADEKADQQYDYQSFGAQFAEVRVHSRTGEIRVTRFVSVMDAGTILNLKTARSQIMGGVVMGIGMALMEETVLDPQNGRMVTRNLADYRVPVNADIPDLQVEFINQPDPHISALGARGLGEIGITGAAAAVANAIFHATGKRIRDLPITPDKLLRGEY